jgi:hypothetical protein
MKTKIILTLTLLTAATIGLVTSLADNNRKINPKNIEIDIKGIYMENPNEKVCLPALLADANRKVTSTYDGGSGQIYKHDPKCEAGVFLVDKDGVSRCTFCNRVEQ